MLLVTPGKAQKILAENTRARRLSIGLTQAGLAERSGVALPTLRKFEQQGVISLESFLKLYMVLGGLEALVKATKVNTSDFRSIDEVLEANNAPKRKRGTRS
ncbi:helix-turn-helix transcriptional regulator [Pseudidiomarina gelatinasegens]|mgnify:CR=1 FL=1|uniref:helix-turn-helix domain-containing protein n=1 Tax=Pseudidiomarina gelatinasegens TaxID=2487740 RepID=UPI0030EF74FB|tara:strand:- start:184 stop:489 length:306 start_codon:yes stop_codon:yes gene_type:complete